METELKNKILKQIGVSEKELKKNIKNYFCPPKNLIDGFIYFKVTNYETGETVTI